MCQTMGKTKWTLMSLSLFKDPNVILSSVVVKWWSGQPNDPSLNSTEVYIFSFTCFLEVNTKVRWFLFLAAAEAYLFHEQWYPFNCVSDVAITFNGNTYIFTSSMTALISLMIVIVFEWKLFRLGQLNPERSR